MKVLYIDPRPDLPLELRYKIHSGVIVDLKRHKFIPKTTKFVKDTCCRASLRRSVIHILPKNQIFATSEQQKAQDMVAKIACADCNHLEQEWKSFTKFVMRNVL
jgi:hypothetical protein